MNYYNNNKYQPQYLEEVKRTKDNVFERYKNGKGQAIWEAAEYQALLTGTYDDFYWLAQNAKGHNLIKIEKRIIARQSLVEMIAFAKLPAVSTIRWKKQLLNIV